MKVCWIPSLYLTAFVCFSIPLLPSLFSSFFHVEALSKPCEASFTAGSVCPSVRVHRIWERLNGFSLNLIPQNFNTLSSHYNFQLDQTFNFIHFWSVTLVNTIKTTSFTPPNVIKLHLLFAHAFTYFGFLVNHLQKAHQLFKGNYNYMIHSYIK
jgi:hypothetical protein